MRASTVDIEPDRVWPGWIVRMGVGPFHGPAKRSIARIARIDYVQHVRDRDRGDIAYPSVLVTSDVGKTVGSVEIGAQRVRERAVVVQGYGAFGWRIAQLGHQRIGRHIRVVAQHTAARRHDQRFAPHFIRIADRRGRYVVDRDRGGVYVKLGETVGDPEADGHRTWTVHARGGEVGHRAGVIHMESHAVVVQVPFVGQRITRQIRIGRTGAVQRDRTAFVHVVRSIGIGHRWLVEAEVGDRVQLVLRQKGPRLAAESAG